MTCHQEDVVFVDAADSGLSHQSAAPRTTTTVSQANTRASSAAPAAPTNSNSKSDTERVGHPCPHCPKTFDRLEHLERHSRKHSGEKPFTCLYAGCGKGFSRYDNMIQHYHCHFDKGHRRKKRDLRETLKRSFMEQDGEARPLTPAENLTLRTLVQASFTPSYPCPAPLPRGRKPSRSKLAAAHKGTPGNPATMASDSPFTSASQSPMSFSRSTSPSEASSTPTSSPASPAASISSTSTSTSTTITPNSSLSSLSSATLPFSSPPSGILTPHCNEVALAPGSFLPFLFQPAQYVLPPSLGHTHSLNPRCQVDEAQLKLLKPKMF